MRNSQFEKNSIVTTPPLLTPTQANSQLIGGEVPKDLNQPFHYPNIIEAGSVPTHSYCSVPTHSYCAQENRYHELI